MNRDEILTMQAGREIDALIAEKAMMLDGVTLGESGLYYQLGHKFYNVPHYSTDIAAAWKVVEKLQKISDNHFTLLCFTTNFRAGWKTPDSNDLPNRQNGFVGFSDFVYADTAPLAICRAALLSVMEAK